MKNSKLTLAKSLLALLMCVTMLVSTTFAWFTDSVTSSRNMIATGTLDVELYHSNGAVTNERVTESTQLFLDQQGNPILWEPGVVSYENLRIVNEGSLALVYQLALNVTNENYIIDGGNRFGLSQVLKVGVVEDGITATDRDSVINAVSSWTKLESLLRDGSLIADAEKTWGIVIYWQPGDNDNNWNANNGKQLSSGTALSIDLGVNLTATQEMYENDSFGNDYDVSAKDDIFPSFGGGIASAPVDVANGLTTSTVEIAIGDIKAIIPTGVKVKDGVNSLSLTIKTLDSSSANIVLGEDEALRSLDVHVEGVAADNTTPIIVFLPEVAPKGLNLGNYKLYHVENGATNEMTLVASAVAFDAHNQFKYDPATGDVALYMATFSEVAVVADYSKKWTGKADHTWYDASKTELTIANADQLWSFSQIVGGMAEDIKQDSFSGKTVTLLADINLADDEENNNPNLIFYPIGYYNSESTYDRTNTSITSGLRNFEGTFNGAGHTIKNFYHNTWEMKGDHNWYAPEDQYYRDGMGLFGRLYKATITNLTVKNFSSDGEIATTGVIAAYADGATFENIAIVDCNPRVYNIGNGGIVGCVGWYAKNDTLVTKFTNVTVDNSNKISALWGSYDVACGGIVGQYYPTSGQNDSLKNGGIQFVDCHIAAVMDVYNDVCGNYQYYAYRYAGMLIGSVRENETIDGHVYPKMDGITASGCTVHFGTWNDYYYCEFVENGHPSYSGPTDYKFSRVPNSEIDTSNGKENATCIGHNHTEDEDNQAIYLPFNNLVTGYGWGVTSKGLTDFKGVENMDITSGDHENSVEKFKGNVTSLDTDKEYNLGSIFSYIESCGVKLIPGAVTVSITNEADNNPVSAIITYERNDDWKNGTIKFKGTGKVNITIQDYYFCTPTTITVDVTDRQPEEKFDVVMNNGNFLHRVGNVGTVALDKLFKAKDGVSVGTVDVTIEAVNGTSASGTYSNNAIQFNGTGVVKVTIKDDDKYCTPTVLNLEVVYAWNTTGATSAPYQVKDSEGKVTAEYNVVLLQDAGFSSLTVSGGYTLYGNGFTLTCGSDSAALDMGYSFVTLNNGTLDNVQIVTPNFDYAVLYKSNMTESGNRSETTDKTRYYNVKSGVMVSGNSQILNSRISGARAAVNVSGGDCVIDNSRIELGAVASLLVGSANSLTLRDVTLVQKPTASTHDSSKTLMGFSALFICDADGNAAPVTLEGTLVQNAWVDENDKQYVPSAGQSIVSTVLSKTEYLHDIDGDGTKESLNLGFAYMPESLTSKVNTTTITDNRTNKDAIPYDYAEVSILNGKTYVYSYKNTNSTADSFKTESEYKPNKYSDIITVNYSDAADGLTTGKSFGTNGWVYELNVDLDKLSGYALDFSKLSMSVNGTAVTDFKVNGNAKPTSPVAVTAGGTTYTLTATVNGKEYTAAYKVTGTETSKESPSLVAANYEAGLCVASSYGGTWHGAAPALEGIQIKYWSVAEKQYKTINLSDYTPTTKGQLNGTNTTWTYSPANGDFTLTLTGGQVHSSNNVYAMPVVCDSKLYFVAAKSTGLVNSGNSDRTIPVSYTFKDNNNGDVLTFSHTWSVAENKDDQYKYSDFCSGTLTKLEGNSSSSGGCVTGDTLVTLADGSKKRIDKVTHSDKLLVWDFFKGEYTTVPSALIVNHGYGDQTIIKLTFDDGTVVKAITAHSFFDANTNKWELLNASNASAYIGHTFVQADGNSYTTAKLVDVDVYQEYTESYSLVSAYHYNFITENMFSLTNSVHNMLAGLVVGDDMTYDEVTLKQDIAKYGTYTYADFADYITYQQYVAFNGDYLKISVEKGCLTFDDILALIKLYL